MTRIERLREIKRGSKKPSGESSSKANLEAWSKRASANSLHPGKTPPKAGGPGRSDKNHLGENYMPGVRRIGS